MLSPRKNLPLAEFICLLTLMTSVLAMSTDVMLPSLDLIGRDLGAENPNSAQLIVHFLFVGFTIGQLVAGPISDCIGRRPTIFIGYFLFIAGCLLSMASWNFEIMLLGRTLQGIGAAAPRIVSMAIVRDCYEGNEMGRIMSIIMAVFILIPTVSPFIGQGIILVFDWRATFAWLFVLAAAAVAWYGIRQPETLRPDLRQSLSAGRIVRGFAEVCRIRVTVGYSICAGLIFGSFIGYLGTSQQIYVGTYGTGLLFPAYFAGTSLALGIGSFVSSKLVLKLGMKLIVRTAFQGIALTALAFTPFVIIMDGIPPLWSFLIWHVATFLGMGLVFGNLSSLAMEPLGKMAGIGAALVGSLSMGISLPLGWIVGYFYDGGVSSIVIGYSILAIGALLVMNWTERSRELQPAR